MKGFKIILQIMRAVIAGDAVAAIYFLHSWLAVFALAAQRGHAAVLRLPVARSVAGRFPYLRR